MIINNQNPLPIPDVIDPGETVCLQIDVPKSRAHVSLLYGALYNLTLWNSYDPDSAHSGKQLAALWRTALATLRTCSGAPVFAGIEEDFEMPLRVDCDCNVFVTCCDGTEKQILTSEQVKAIIQSQPGSGAPQPAPGGGCQSYDGQLTAPGRWLIPTPVNTGDVITMESISGATYDSAGLLWLCPNGSQYFAGGCVGGTLTDGTAPVPAAPLGSPVVKIGSNYYSLLSPVTVGAGVVNTQPELLVNYPSSYSPTGTLTFTVQVCNNQSGTWTRVLDFTVSNYAAIITPHNGSSGPRGLWTVGLGWAPNSGSGGSNPSDYIQFDSATFPSFIVDSVSFQLAGNLPIGGYWQWFPNGSTDRTAVEATGSATHTITVTDAMTSFFVGIDTRDGSVAPILQRITLSGHGAPPF